LSNLFGPDKLKLLAIPVVRTADSGDELTDLSVMAVHCLANEFIAAVVLGLLHNLINIGMSIAHWCG
jgi:hypothetical protein